jgi:hypothetical protein
VSTASASSAAGAKSLLDAIATRPRPAGGAAEAEARAFCARELTALGFSVAERPFEYSALPGRWATPLAGLAAILIVAAAGHVGARGHHWAALAGIVTSVLLLALGGFRLARDGVLDLPFLRERSANLVARRGGGDPVVWLVAHLDTKSQPVPILARALGIVALSAIVALAAATGVAQAAGAAGARELWPWLAALAPIAGAPVLLSVVRSRSPGAVDDGSGVATVLLAARLTPRATPLGVLLTSAEELGLAGARAWAREAEPAVALNCDGIDDAGELVCMYGRSIPAPVVDAVRRASGGRARVRRLLPGILADSVALADAGWAAVTLSRGTAATLARIHRPADTSDRMTGEGIAATAAVVVGSIERLAATAQDGAGAASTEISAGAGGGRRP